MNRLVCELQLSFLKGKPMITILTQPSKATLSACLGDVRSWLNASGRQHLTLRTDLHSKLTSTTDSASMSTNPVSHHLK